MIVALLYTQTMLLAAPAEATPAPGEGDAELREGWCAAPSYSGPWYCLARCTEATEFYVADANPLDLSGDWDAAQADCYLKAVDFCTTAFMQYLDRSCLGGAFE